MNMDRSLVFRSDPENLQCFPSCGPRRVGGAEAHGRFPLLQSIFEALHNLLEFIIRSLFVDRRTAGKKVARIVHHFHAHANVPYAGSVVDDSPAFSFCVPSANVGSARFQFQRRSYAIHGLHPVVLGNLTMLVQINETGGDHEPAPVNSDWTFDESRRQSFNLPVPDSDISHSIQLRLWIYHTAAYNDDVEIGSTKFSGAGNPAKRQQCNSSQPAGEGQSIGGRCHSVSLHRRMDLCGTDDPAWVLLVLIVRCRGSGTGS